MSPQSLRVCLKRVVWRDFVPPISSFWVWCGRLRRPHHTQQHPALARKPLLEAFQTASKTPFTKKAPEHNDCAQGWYRPLRLLAVACYQASNVRQPSPKPGLGRRERRRSVNRFSLAFNITGVIIRSRDMIVKSCAQTRPPRPCRHQYTWSPGHSVHCGAPFRAGFAQSAWPRCSPVGAPAQLHRHSD